jgi:predicted metal-dependent peptidase
MGLFARELKGDEVKLVEDSLLLARAVRPYYGLALSALQPHAVDGLQTVAVDANWNLYIDTAWLSALDPEKRAGVIACHEIEHLLRNHPGRQDLTKAEKELWNIAADAEINDDCDQAVLPDGCVHPSNFGAKEGLTCEEYLDMIPVTRVKIVPKCGSGSGGEPGEYELEATDKDGNKVGVSQEIADQIRASTAQAVKEHVKQHGRGDVPNSIVMWADVEAAKREVLPPSWDRKLSHLLGSKSRELTNRRADYTFGKIHRRTRAGQVIRPTLAAPKIKVGLVIDTSGSMCGYGSEVLTAVQQITKRYDFFTIDCDASVKSISKKKKGFQGGGGTDLTSAIKQADKMADAIVVVTDCDTPWPDKTRAPMIVVATSTSSSPDWATRVQVKQ